MKIQDSTPTKSEDKSAEGENASQPKAIGEKKPKSFNEREAFGDKPFQKPNQNKFNAKIQNSFGGKSGSSRSVGKSFSSGGARGR